MDGYDRTGGGYPGGAEPDIVVQNFGLRSGAPQGSNSIEGCDASLDDVLAAVDVEDTLEAGEPTQLSEPSTRTSHSRSASTTR